jgi:hypothetical protein
MGFCAGLKKGNHTATVYVQSTPGFEGSDCLTGWSDYPSGKGQNWLLDAREISETSRVVGVTGYGPEDAIVGDAVKPIKGRAHSFTKTSSSTVLKLVYQDNMQSVGGCWYELFIDGRSCTSGPIRAFRSDPNNRFHQIVGYCQNVPSGKHIIEVKVIGNNRESRCTTGFKDIPQGSGASWTIFAEEVQGACTPIKTTPNLRGASSDAPNAWDADTKSVFSAGQTEALIRQQLVERLEVFVAGGTDADLAASTIVGLDALGREIRLASLQIEDMECDGSFSSRTPPATGQCALQRNRLSRDSRHQTVPSANRRFHHSGRHIIFPSSDAGVAAPNQDH